MNYYNENDPHAAEWLVSLIDKGLIPDGWVDTRSIEDVKPENLEGFTQHHFFAGIGGWPLALSLAGWPDHIPVWTASCPCQPFSTAGRRKGAEDSRHLWPALRWLITNARPPIVFGEQVASPDGRVWLSRVRAEVEALGYGVGAADLCAAGVFAPHARQRLYWVADTDSERREGQRLHIRERGSQQGVPQAGGSGEGAGRMADTSGRGCKTRDVQGPGEVAGTGWEAGGSTPHGSEGDRPVGLGDSSSAGAGRDSGAVLGTQAACPSEWLNPWDLPDCIVVTGADGKARRIKSGIEPLVDGLPGRLGLLKGYGNAIVPQVAAQFIGAYADG